MFVFVFVDVREVELRFDIYEVEVGCMRCSVFVLRGGLIVFVEDVVIYGV